GPSGFTDRESWHSNVNPGPPARDGGRQSAVPRATGGLAQRADRERDLAGAAAHDPGPAGGAPAAAWSGGEQRAGPGGHHREGLQRTGGPGTAAARGPRPARPQPPDPRREATGPSQPVGSASPAGVQLPAHPDPGSGLPGDPQITSRRTASPLRRLARVRALGTGHRTPGDPRLPPRTVRPVSE